MSQITTAKIVEYDGCNMLIIPQEPISREMIRKQVKNVELRLCDGRECTSEQRRKIFAIIGEIADWSGHDSEDLRKYFTSNYCMDNDLEYFSLSPKKPNLADMEEIGKYLYMCLEHRKCAICNDKAEVHHLDAVGMGRDRNDIVHVGMNAIALCRKHHIQAHNMGKNEFLKQYHVYGIILDSYLCKILNLGRKAVYNELFERDKQFLQLEEVRE